MGQNVEIRGYTDPRTGEYKRATEANREEAAEDIGFIMAWKYYWDGPPSPYLVEDRLSGDLQPAYEREAWLVSSERRAWLDDLTEVQRQMLADCPPPEEIPALEDAS